MLLHRMYQQLRVDNVHLLGLETGLVALEYSESRPGARMLLVRVSDD